jgi:hypothetical protein
MIPGVAGYEYGWTGLTAAATFTPNLLSLFTNGAPDTIGCTPESTSLRIPEGWMWWANVDLKIKTTGAPTAGDFLEWSALNEYGAGSVRYDPMLDSSSTAQRFGATVVGTAGPDPYGLGGPSYDGVYVPEFKSALGTVFVPVQLDIYVTAIRPVGLGFSGGIS